MHRKKVYIVVALILLLVAGFLATSLISYFVARDSIAQQISEQTLPLTSDNIYSEIQRDMLRPVLISSLMAHNTFLRDWIVAGEQDSELVRRYLAEIQNSYDTITAFFTSEATRNYYHSTGIVKQVDLASEADAWYARVREMRAPYGINIDIDTVDRNRLSVFVNYRVLDEAGNYLGAAGVGLAVTSVTTLINNYQQRYGRSIYFVDRQGRVTLTGTNGSAVTQQSLQERPGLDVLAAQVLSSPSTSLRYTNALGNTVFLNSRLVPEFDWYLVVEQDESSATAQIHSTLLINTSLALFIMALVLAAGHFTLKTWQRQLEFMATTDQLTGVANRHMFEILFEQTMKRAQREQVRVSLLAIDIDHFKRINDTWGHQGGDLALQRMAELLQAHVRASDVVCRWGGEEFIVMLDNCSQQEAGDRAKALAVLVRGLQIPYGREHISLTVSCGVAELRAGESLESAVARVDKALYTAKGQGRDQVYMATSQLVG
ncbi:MAG TPA: diguanylate cyclase [Pseudomonadaceae bacterium]|nr:diguanylate cyclase [Pseudomonadaceae bacterium]